MDFIVGVVLQLYKCMVLIINTNGKKKERKKTGYPRKRHI